MLCLLASKLLIIMLTITHHGVFSLKGNGKVKTKEPLEMANKAIGQLKEILDVVGKSSD